MRVEAAFMALIVV